MQNVFPRQGALYIMRPVARLESDGGNHHSKPLPAHVQVDAGRVTSLS